MTRVSTLVAALSAASLFAGCHPATSPSTVEPSPSYTESNQIPWSATPGSDAACAGVPNYWTWNLTIAEANGGSGLTVDYLDSTLDGVAQPRLALNRALPAKGQVVIARVVCVPAATQHIVQETLVSNYKGSPNTFGNTITLLAK